MVDSVRPSSTPLPTGRALPTPAAAAPPEVGAPIRVADANASQGRLPGRSAELMRSLAGSLDDLTVPPPPDVDTHGQMAEVAGSEAVRENSGETMNAEVTENYHEIGTRLDEYLAHPGVVNWPQIGQHASATAGEAIQPLESVLKGDVGGLKQMLVSGEFFGLFKDFGLPLLFKSIQEHGLKELMDLSPWKMATTFGKNLGLAKDMIQKLPELLSNPQDAAKILGKDALEMVTNVLAPLLPDKIVGQLFSDLGVLHEGLVATNANIHNDFAPAFDAFLDAESQGSDGVAAVRAMVASGELKDPSGLVVDALACYQQARLTSDPAAKRALIERANMLIAMHEQHHVAQPAFADQRFQELCAVVSQDLVMSDPSGDYPLLPQGGNWADFETRMGMAEVPASEAEARFTSNDDPSCGLYRVTDEDGGHRYYELKPSAEREGTISGYFDHLAQGGAEVAAQVAEAP